MITSNDLLDLYTHYVSEKNKIKEDPRIESNILEVTYNAISDVLFRLYEISIKNDEHIEQMVKTGKIFSSNGN